jgi:hypothetical protein
MFVSIAGIACIASPAALTSPAPHTAPEKVFEDGLEVIHVGMLPLAAVETSKAAPEDVLILEALEGVFFSGAGLVIVFAFALVGERLVCAG